MAAITEDKTTWYWFHCSFCQFSLPPLLLHTALQELSSVPPSWPAHHQICTCQTIETNAFWEVSTIKCVISLEILHFRAGLFLDMTAKSVYRSDLPLTRQSWSYECIVMPTMDSSTVNKHTVKATKSKKIRTQLLQQLVAATLLQVLQCPVQFYPVTGSQQIKEPFGGSLKAQQTANLCKMYKLRTLRSASGERYLPFSLSRSSCNGNWYRSLICQSKPTPYPPL